MNTSTTRFVLSRAFITTLLASSVFASGCGGDDGPQPPPVSSTDRRRNVLVMDDGIDPSVSDLAGKVVSQFHIACEGKSSGVGEIGGDSAAPPTVEQVKADLLTSLRTRNTRCRLKEGIDAKPDPLDSVASFKSRWNGALNDSVPLNRVFTRTEFDQITGALKGAGDFHFHGTATAATIAYRNPDVRLVLVEFPLSNARQAMENTTCATQDGVDRLVAALTDPEVLQAALEAPPSALEDDLRAMMARYHIGLRNQSYGPVARTTLEAAMHAKNCAPVDLHAFFAAVAEIDRRQAAAHPEEVLPVLAAGNDGTRIDGPEDERTCYQSPVPRLVVGAYGVSGVRAKFSNFGACVDVFAPGVAVLAPLPGGWLLPMNGTSFSAPLIARMISRDRMGPFSPESAREDVLGLRDTQQHVPIAQFPQERLYDPGDLLASALTSVGVHLEPEGAQDRVSALELDRLLALLKLGEGR